MGHPPKALHPKEPARLQFADLGQHDCADDVDEQRNGRDPGQKAEDYQCAADDFDHPVEIGEKRGSGDADLFEAARPQLMWLQELLDALAEKNQPHQQPHADHGGRPFGMQ